MCKEEFPLTAEFFYVNKKSKTGLAGACKKCKLEYQKERHSRPEVKEHRQEQRKKYYGKPEVRIRQSWTEAKIRSKEKEMEFSIIWEKWPYMCLQPCEYCGIEALSYEKSEGWPNVNGIDRIDSNRGYTLDNVVTCCGTCNRMKMDHTQQEFFEQAKRIVEHMNAT
jgi:hypothetical protein